MGNVFSASTSQNIFGFVALIVSAVALLTTVLQVLQQYFSSAEGYRRCTKEVMELWSRGTRRKLRWREFRVEVLFETPVILLAPPTNQRGPVKDKKVNYIDGTPTSYEITRVHEPLVPGEVDKQPTGVHTADDERASWVTLLSQLQLEERSSRAWDEKARTGRKTPGSDIKPPKYTLAVGIQSKTRSWDFVPASITRPYATTAICHLVEMTAMLGMYWQLFDGVKWNLRAEGNGLILTSTSVHGLGVMVVFSVTGKSKYEEDRLIPADEVKELAFGSVPNIFDDNNEFQSLSIKLGSEEDALDTLESLGCQAPTLKKYKKDHKHIFPVSFEIIGMIGKVISLRGSNFKMIPNPTHDPWLKRSGVKASWKITKLMEVFQRKLTESLEKEESAQASFIIGQWARIKPLDLAENNIGIEVRESIHDAIDEVTNYLLGLEQSDVIGVLALHIKEVMDVLADPASDLNTIFLVNVRKEETLLEYYFDKIRFKVMHGIIAGTSTNNEISKEKKNDIWITLIFRMLCWLLIHDWDKNDVCRVPSNLKGSRMPVFIG